MTNHQKLVERLREPTVSISEAMRQRTQAADALVAARNAALEEAIQVCEELYDASPMTLAREIRALKK